MTQSEHGLINREEGMHCAYLANVKAGVIDTCFLISGIATSIRVCTPYIFQRALLGTRKVQSLNLAYHVKLCMCGVSPLPDL